MRQSIAIFGLICLFLASALVDEALAEAKEPTQLIIKITAKVPNKAQQVLDAYDTIILPISESLQLEDLEQAIPQKVKTIKSKKLDAPALSWDSEKRQVKFARR